MAQQRGSWRGWKILLATTVAGGILMAASLQYPQGAHAADRERVQVRVGKHDVYTRVVFDFPKLTPYSADNNAGDIDLTFTTPLPVPAPTGTGMIQGVKTDRIDQDTVRMSIDLADGATFKHYRLLRKVVIDIFPTGAVPPPQHETTLAAQKQAAEKKLAEAKPSGPKPKSKPPEKKQPVVKAEKPKEMAIKEPAKPVTASAEPAAVAPPPATSMPAPEMKPEAQTDTVKAISPDPATIGETTMILSSIEPVNIAVFSRFNTLWIVLDREFSGSLGAEVRGADADLLGKPKLLKFKGGSAYRYNMPPGRMIDVVKKSLSWEIRISGQDAKRHPPTALNVVIDETSKKAKVVADMRGSTPVLDVEDPMTGDMLFVVPAAQESDRVTISRRFPDLEIIPAAVGMVMRPLSDAIKANRIQDHVIITSPQGIMASATADAAQVIPDGTRVAEAEKGRLFDFPNWRQGGIAKLADNARRLQADIAGASLIDDRRKNMMTLALLYFANNMGHETLSVLRLLAAEDAEMEKNPHFIAVRGAAAALAGHYDDAMRDLNAPAIQQNPEIALWRGFAAAATEQWQLANNAFPMDNYYLQQYPPEIAVPFTIYMAESALRLGNADTATSLLSTITRMPETGAPRYQAAMQYLRGEAARQNGDAATAIRLWTPVAAGIDRLYHTKAELALALLELQQKRITLQQAIDRLDTLRFGWRGDGLEVQILETIGKLKAENKRYLEGLHDLKTAVTLTESMGVDANPLRADMAEIVTGLFVAENKTSPLEAISIYNEFGSMIREEPLRTDAALQFADYLIRMDLLDKAAKLLEDEIARGLPPARIPAVGARLAAAYLLDARPSESISALKRTASDGMDDDLRAERQLLQARAQSQLNLTDDAIATLSAVSSPAAAHLRADVYWKARRWDKAAEAIEALLPPAGSKLDDAAARHVVNAAVAWKLAGDTPRLLALRANYESGMLASPLAPVFGVVTRDGGGAGLSDRDTILKIAGEVDMFKGFLENYKSGG